MKPSPKRFRVRLSKLLFQSPARMSITGFLVLILTGALLLMQPAASTGKPVGFIDALFTATSAGCVTGLSVMDIGSRLTPFGQSVLLMLIQLGGLGIMTVSVLFILSAGKRAGLGGRIVIQDTFTHSGEQNPAHILREVFKFTFICEGIGALLLFFRFFPANSFAEASSLAVFHAVSAFCNAGFALFPDSLTVYRGDPAINLVISLLIICGGSGFLFLSEILRKSSWRTGGWARLSLHSKLVLSSTLTLLLLGFLVIAGMEWHNTLSTLPVHERLLAAFFQSVSTRTAGFNTLPIGAMANETLFFMMVLMFIGACPGSCGGGIKATTLVTLVLWGLSGFRGHSRPQIFGRSIPRAGVEKAISIVILSMLVVFAGTMALLMTEVGEVSHYMSRGKFLEIFFEVVSAFGTVGLTCGLTETLSFWGKLIITCIMFVGRLGPLVVAVAFITEKRTRFRYAEENIMVG